VGLNVTSGLLLNTLASSSDPNLFVLGLGFAVVFLLNAWRLVIWMFANKRFPLSTIYPFTSLFFPVMLVVSFAYHEPITLNRIAGTLLITSGVFWLGWRVSRSGATPL
jgi:drug/metabolite transporter (DMT)-like permease